MGSQRAGTTPRCTATKRRTSELGLVHGDDFVSSGYQETLEWLYDKMKKRFKVSKKVTRARENEDEERKVLHRIICVSSCGWEYEADQRHAEIIIKTLNMEHTNPICTLREERWMTGSEKEPLTPTEAAACEALVARANYLRSDRPDLQKSVKELSSSMSTPTQADTRKLRRLTRYLVGRTWLVLQFNFQRAFEDLNEYSDSDWAGCLLTARTSVG